MHTLHIEYNSRVLNGLLRSWQRTRDGVCQEDAAADVDTAANVEDTGDGGGDIGAGDVGGSEGITSTTTDGRTPHVLPTRIEADGQLDLKDRFSFSTFGYRRSDNIAFAQENRSGIIWALKEGHTSFVILIKKLCRSYSFSNYDFDECQADELDEVLCSMAFYVAQELGRAWKWCCHRRPRA